MSFCPQWATVATRAVCRLVVTCPAAPRNSPTTTPSATAWTAMATQEWPTWVCPAHRASWTAPQQTLPTAVSIKVMTNPALSVPHMCFPFLLTLLCCCSVGCLLVCFVIFWECVLLDKRRGDSGGWTTETFSESDQSKQPVEKQKQLQL